MPKFLDTPQWYDSGGVLRSGELYRHAFYIYWRTDSSTTLDRGVRITSSSTTFYDVAQNAIGGFFFEIYSGESTAINSLTALESMWTRLYGTSEYIAIPIGVYNVYGFYGAGVISYSSSELWARFTMTSTTFTTMSGGAECLTVLNGALPLRSHTVDQVSDHVFSAYRQVA